MFSLKILIYIKELLRTDPRVRETARDGERAREAQGESETERRSAARTRTYKGDFLLHAVHAVHLRMVLLLAPKFETDTREMQSSH